MTAPRTAAPSTPAPATSAPSSGRGAVALHDVEDLADADLDAVLDDRLADGGWVPLRADAAGAGTGEVGRVIAGPTARCERAEAVALGWAIRRTGAVGAAVHALGLRGALLAAC